MSYQVTDELGELMRVVGRLEEAKTLVANRAGWSYKRVRIERPAYQFEEAPF